MSEPPRRVIMEKSRTVRRRYQRSNKRLQFTPSQIARIERDQERERRAKQLQEKEKKRIANKKKKAQKEAQEREERRRQGHPDPNAFRVPSSQPLLSKFLAKPKTDSPPIQTESISGKDGDEDGDEDGDGGEGEGEGETPGEDDTEPDTPRSVETEADPFEMPELGAEATAEDLMVAIDSTTDDLKDHTHDATEYNDNEDNEDEFSDCSAFYDEDLIRETEIAAIAQDHTVQKVPQEARQTKLPVEKPVVEESFRDDTADFLEEFAGDFYADEDFEKELTNLGAV